MKRFLVLIVAVSIMLNIFAGCTKNENNFDKNEETVVEQVEETTQDIVKNEVSENAVSEGLGITANHWYISSVEDSKTGETIESFTYPFIPKLTFLDGGTVICLVRSESGSESIKWKWEPIESPVDEFLQYVIVNQNGNYLNVAYNPEYHYLMLVGWGDYTYLYDSYPMP